MHGIPAYNTGGLRANFAGSDLIIETGDQRKKLWLQVKTGAPIAGTPSRTRLRKSCPNAAPPGPALT
jgi:hypothetical protein